MIVVDASALLEVLLNRRAAAPIAERLFAPGETLHAPHLLDVEVAQVLRRYAASGELDGARGARALEVMAEFALTRYPHQPLMLRIWALRHNITAYDAAYIALAEALAIPLVTRDAALAATRGHRATVELV